MKHRTLLFALIAAASVCAASLAFAQDGGTVLTDAESAVGWGRDAALTATGDAKQGRHAIALAAAEGEGFFATAFNLTPARAKLPPSWTSSAPPTARTGRWTSRCIRQVC